MNITTMALLIPIIAIIGGFIMEFMKLRERQSHQSSEHQKEFQAMQTQITELKDRIEVLEKLVTDDGFELGRQIDRMKHE